MGKNINIKKMIIVGILLSCFGVAGCGFLEPIVKTDAQGNQVIVAKGSQYLETAQGVLGDMGGIPVFGAIASGIAGLLGVAVAVSNSAARKRSNALAATVQGVSVFTDNYDTVKTSIVDILKGANQPDLANKVQDVFDKNQSLKSTVQKIANSKGIETFLNWFVQKFDPAKVSWPRQEK